MEQLIHVFYQAFRDLDPPKMRSCYHQDAVFEDPAFGILKGVDIFDMWTMLCEKSEDLEITYSDVDADNEIGSADWEARYTFKRTGRKVHNIIHSKFRFQDGLIIDHRDTFDLGKWASQAFGWQGRLMGRTGYFKHKLQKRTNGMLQKYQAKLHHPSESFQ